jgi:hypothetical protein
MEIIKREMEGTRVGKREEIKHISFIFLQWRKRFKYLPGHKINISKPHAEILFCSITLYFSVILPTLQWSQKILNPEHSPVYPWPLIQCNIDLKEHALNGTSLPPLLKFSGQSYSYC